MKPHPFVTLGRACGVPEEELRHEKPCARAIIKFLNKKRWKQSQICDYLGISPPTLRNIERAAEAELVDWRAYVLPGEEMVRVG